MQTLQPPAPQESHPHPHPHPQLQKHSRRRAHSASSVELPPEQSNAIWLPDNSTTECFTCSTRFTLFNRRHHCRFCGRVICGQCSSFQVIHHAAASPGLLSIAVSNNGANLRQCIECHTAALLYHRGIPPHVLIDHIYTSTSSTNRLEEKCALLTQLTNIEKEIQLATIEEMEKREGENRELQTDLDDTADAAERMSHHFTAIAQKSALIFDSLQDIRLQDGFIATCVCLEPKQVKDAKSAAAIHIQPWHTRLFIITPFTSNVRLCALSSFIYPNPNTEVVSATTDLRFAWVYTTEALISYRPTQVHIDGRNIPAISITVANYEFQDENKASGQPNSSSSSAAAGNTEGKRTELHYILAFTESTTSAALSTLHAFLFPVFEETETPVGYSPTTPQSENVQEKLMYQWDTQSEALQTFHLHHKKHAEATKVIVAILECAYNDMKTPVSWQDSSHADLLQRLWASYTKSSPFPGLKSPAWKGLGFQGEDPTTDFRGMGVLALRCLVYAGERHPELMGVLVDAVHSRPYPLCAAGVNVVSLLVGLLSFNSSKLPFKTVDDELIPSPHLLQLPLFRFMLRLPVSSLAVLSPTSTLSEQLKASPNSVLSLPKTYHTFEELFAHFLPALDREVVRSGATYFTFNTVLDRIKQNLIEALRMDVATMEEAVRKLEGITPGSSVDNDYVGAIDPDEEMSDQEIENEAEGNIESEQNEPESEEANLAIIATVSNNVEDST